MTARFCDQFSALLIDEDELWSPSGSTLVRMPFSQECMKDGLEMGLKNIESKTDKFLEHASRVLLFLKSVLQVRKQLTTSQIPQVSVMHYLACTIKPILLFDSVKSK